MATLLDFVWNHMINEGIGRDPRVAGPLPPIWRQPIDGTPAPGEGEGVVVGPTAVIGILAGPQIPRPKFQKDWPRSVVDIWYRTKSPPVARQLFTDITTAFIDKVNWDMAGMRVIETNEWRGMALLESNMGQGYTYLSSLIFQTYADLHT